MQRIHRIHESEAPRETVGLLATVRRQMGTVPNIIATMAQSPAALSGYLGLSGALARGRLPGGLREQVALAVAGANRCDYCASAHTALARGAGIPSDEARRNLRGEASDGRVRSALEFANRVVATRGNVADDDLSAVRAAGFSDEEIVELVANTVLNIFTNYFNHVAGTEIDFPVVAADAAAA